MLEINYSKLLNENKEKHPGGRILYKKSPQQGGHHLTQVTFELASNHCVKAYN